MKKLLYSSFSICSLYISACETNNVSNTGKEAKGIGKRCAESSSYMSPTAVKVKVRTKTPDQTHNVSSVLPAYFWDTKSMNW